MSKSISSIGEKNIPSLFESTGLVSKELFSYLASTANTESLSVLSSNLIFSEYGEKPTSLGISVNVLSSSSEYPAVLPKSL